MSALVIVTCLAAYPLMKYASIEFITAAIVGSVLTTANVLLGYAAIQYSFDKSMMTFLKYVLGGMGLRLIVMAGLLVLLIKVFYVHVVGLIASMGVFYVIFLTLEVLFIQRKVGLKQRS